MKIVQQTTTYTLKLYHQLAVGQVYSHERAMGTRIELRHYMCCSTGMVCLENGAYIPGEAFTSMNGACYGWGFKHCPDAALSV